MTRHGTERRGGHDQPVAASFLRNMTLPYRSSSVVSDVASRQAQTHKTTSSLSHVYNQCFHKLGRPCSTRRDNSSCPHHCENSPERLVSCNRCLSLFKCLVSRQRQQLAFQIGSMRMPHRQQLHTVIKCTESSEYFLSLLPCYSRDRY
jgi:hypothetical protein